MVFSTPCTCTGDWLEKKLRPLVVLDLTSTLHRWLTRSVMLFCLYTETFLGFKVRFPANSCHSGGVFYVFIEAGKLLLYNRTLRAGVYISCVLAHENEEKNVRMYTIHGRAVSRVQLLLCVIYSSRCRESQFGKLSERARVALTLTRTVCTVLMFNRSQFRYT